MRIPMKALIMFLCVVSPALFAQSTAVSIKTGDTDLDAALVAMNTEAKANVGAFYSQISTEFEISAFKIELSCGSGVMEPAEAYLAVALSKSAKKGLEEIVALFKKDKKAGWAPVIKELGFKAGSAEFKDVKNKVASALAKVKQKNKKP